MNYFPTRSIALFLLILGSITCTGCKDLSRLPPFSDYVGKEIPLQRPVYLGVYHPGSWLNEGYWLSDELIPNDKKKEKTQVALLPIGTLVKIKKVQKLYKPIFASGTLIHPETKTKISFSYDCFPRFEDLNALTYEDRKKYHFDIIGRAPWENQSLPPIRNVDIYATPK